MNKYVKNYLQRGIAFGGLGPMIAGIVFLVLDLTGADVALTGTDMFIAILSTYVLAFVQAGSSVFNQVEEWPLALSTGVHFASLYLVYIGVYLVNRWIPFIWEVIVLFTVIFVIAYLAVWLTVYFITRGISKKLNENIR
jgi:hypothetical protein